MLVLIFFIFRITEQCCSPPQRCRIMIREQVHSEDLYTLAQAQPPKMATMTAVLLTLTHTSTHTHTGTCYFTFCFGLTMTCSCWKKPTNEITDWSYYVSDCIRAFQAM